MSPVTEQVTLPRFTLTPSPYPWLLKCDDRQEQLILAYAKATVAYYSAYPGRRKVSCY